MEHLQKLRKISAQQDYLSRVHTRLFKQKEKIATFIYKHLNLVWWTQRAKLLSTGSLWAVERDWLQAKLGPKLDSQKQS